MEEHAQGTAFVVLEVDRRGALTRAEGSGLPTFGIASEEGLGRPASEVLRDWPELPRGIDHALSGQSDGAVIEARQRAFAVRFEPRWQSGDVVGALAVAVESPDGSASAFLTAAERHLDLLLRQVPAAVWATDRELRFTHLVGRSTAEVGLGPFMVGGTLQELMGTDSPTDPVIAHHLAALAGKREAFRLEFRGHWFEAQVEPLRDERGSIEGCVGAAVDITDRQQFEQRLAESEARLGQAQTLAHVGSFEFDINANHSIWSDELYRIYGVSPEQHPGTYESFLNLAHPEDRESTGNVIFEAIRQRKPLVYDHRIVRPDGAVRVLHTTADVVCDAQGTPTKVMGSCWDITEQRDTNAQLERSVSLLKATLDATADGILVVDHEGRLVAHNERFLEMWRIPADLAHTGDDERIMGYVLDQLVDPADFEQRVRTLYDRPEESSFDTLHFHDGRVFERFSSPQRLGDAIVGRVWSFRDVTDREAILCRTMLLAVASPMLASLEPEVAFAGVVQLAVRAFCDACCIVLLDDQGPRRIIAGQSAEVEAIPKELDRSVLAGHSALMQTETRSRMSVPLKRKDAFVGAITCVRVAPRRFRSGEVAFIEELAGRASLSLEIANLYRLSEQAVRGRDELLAIAAHEIRGPLSGMRLAAQSLRRGGLEPPAAGRALELIEREDRRLERLVSELVDIGRIRMGRLQFSLEPVDLPELAREVVGRLAPELRRSRSPLSLHSEEQVRGHWDRFRLEQVITNLLTNAIKFGLGKPLSLEISRRGDRAALVVRDQGIGIEPKLQEQIFEPFERAVSTRHYGGLGLGLYIVRSIVEGLGGSIQLESSPGQGSTFTVELPLEGHS